MLGAKDGLAVVARVPGAQALVIDAAGAHASEGFRSASGFEPLPAAGAR